MSRQPYVDPREPDPRFPDRPTHPDFAVLSDAMQEVDGSIDDGVPAEEWLKDRVDVESLMYIIEEQAKRFAEEVAGGGADGGVVGEMTELARVVCSAGMMAGFALGVEYARKEHGHDET